MSSVYEWKDRLQVATRAISLNKVVDPQKAGEAIEELRDDNGEVTPEVLVDAARPKRSFFHKSFNWEDVDCAERYRLEQARYILRSVQVVVEVPEGSTRKIRAFTSVSSVEDPRKRAYVHTVEAMESSDDIQTEILHQCLAGLVAWRRKWADLNELSDFIGTVNKQIKKMEKAVAKG